MVIPRKMFGEAGIATTGVSLGCFLSLEVNFQNDANRPKIFFGVSIDNIYNMT